MLYLLRTNEGLDYTYDRLEVAVEILNSICVSTMECFVILDDNVTMKDGVEVRGRYTLLGTWFPCKPDNKSRGVIFIDNSCNFVEMCTVLVHEYAHHLTQEGHCGKLFNLFKSWLRIEFVSRYVKHESS